MNKAFRVPPARKDLVTPPEILAERLEVLVGSPFPLTLKTRTDGSNARKLVANTLDQHPLPPQCPRHEFTIVRRKGLPRVLLEYVDTYLVTTGRSYDLQVWNRYPAAASVQVEYASGDPLLNKDARFVFVRVDPETEEIRCVLVLTPEYIEAQFGRFGNPTVKHQLIIPPRTREHILRSDPPLLFCRDTPRMAAMVTDQWLPSTASISDDPAPGHIMSLQALRVRIAGRLMGGEIHQDATKKRGQALELLVAQLLGYEMKEGDLLASGFPDIRNQVLEVKVQDSPTVDLGRYTPQFEEVVFPAQGITTLDVRYLIALTHGSTGVIQGAVLCPGAELGEHFSYVSDTSFKCQRSIPMDFFDRHDGEALFNP